MVVDLFTSNMNAYADVLLRGNKGEELSELEQYQYRRHRSAWLWYWTNVVFQHRIGLYDDVEFSRQTEIIRRDMGLNPGLRAHWCANREWASLELIELIESRSTNEYC